MTKSAVDHAQINGWIAEQRGAILSLLEEVVDIDSGSYHKPGVDAVGERFVRFFDEHGIETRRVPSNSFGDALIARTGGDGRATALMMGHRDTVFPRGEAERRPFRVDGARAYGPGVADMKAGLVMNAFVLAAYHRAGQLSAPLAALFTGDEEIASPFSRAVIEEEARKARFVLNSEPGRVNGNVVIARKGGAFMKVCVFGQSAHSGANFKDGISAIEEIAHKIIALHELTDFDVGTTLNVGLVKGGQSVNTTAPEAECRIDLRYRTPADYAETMVRIRQIVDTATVSGTNAELEIMGEFVPMVQTEASRALFELYRDAAGEVGLVLDGEFTGSCADSGFSAAVGTPTLCGVGPVGGKPHTPDEYVEIETLVPRAQAAALAIARLDALPDRH